MDDRWPDGQRTNFRFHESSRVNNLTPYSNLLRYEMIWCNRNNCTLSTKKGWLIYMLRIFKDNLLQAQLTTYITASTLRFQRTPAADRLTPFLLYGTYPLVNLNDRMDNTDELVHNTLWNHLETSRRKAAQLQISCLNTISKVYKIMYILNIRKASFAKRKLTWFLPCYFAT